jgi:hypothetical protein
MTTSQVTRQTMKPIVIYDDNLSEISLPKNPVFHACTKHIEIHEHLVRNKIEEGFVKLVYCNTENMITNIWTKLLSNDKHKYF